MQMIIQILPIDESGSFERNKTDKFKMKVNR